MRDVEVGERALAAPNNTARYVPMSISKAIR